MAASRLHARVHGRVQGVGFRAFTERTARSMGLTGWVRNEPRGTVELVAEGDAATLAGFLEAIRRGPTGARVDAVDETWSDALAPGSHFDIRT